jgi:hypothetical protein
MPKKKPPKRAGKLSDAELREVIDRLRQNKSLSEQERPLEYVIGPDRWWEMVDRLDALLKQEMKRRPAHRPRDDTGREVADLVARGISVPEAKRRVAKRLEKTSGAVEKAYLRHRQRTGQN